MSAPSPLASLPAGAGNHPLALYVHLPWCVRKCPYCDFNSHARPDALPEDDYIAALLADLDQDLSDFDLLAGGRSVQSIFFGGGTPSLFSADAIAKFLDGTARRLQLADGCEITLETNPGAAEYDRFEGYRRAGVNRLSFGVQSFDDGCLARLGRIHGSADAERAVKQAQDAGFDNINLDLMYALPEQSLVMAEHDIERALALSPTHISHYQLTLEPNTVFAARPPSGLPDEDAAFDMQLACQTRLAAVGYKQYEISAYARAGWQCAHNLNYWRFGDYLGIGAGAHGKMTLPDTDRILRRWKVRHPRDYLAKAITSERIGGDEWIMPEQRPFEFMLNALRLVDGWSLTDFEARTGLSREVIRVSLERAKKSSWIEIDADHVRPTELGLRFCNDVIGLFLPDR